MAETIKRGDEMSNGTDEKAEGSNAGLASHPIKCIKCWYFHPDIEDGYCGNAPRTTTARFPFLHWFMKKEKGGWVDIGLDKTGKCRFYICKCCKAS
jgi:hypothetical protein